MSVTLKIAPSFGEVENFDMQVPESIKAEELKTLLMQKLQQDGQAQVTATKMIRIFMFGIEIKGPKPIKDYLLANRSRNTDPEIRPLVQMTICAQTKDKGAPPGGGAEKSSNCPCIVC